MRPALAVCGYLAFIFVGGALLAPWLYKLVAFGSTISPLFQSLARHPFHRFVDRSFLVMGLVGLWPFLRIVGIVSWAEIGLGRRSGARWRLLGLGFSVGFVSLLIAAILNVLAGNRAWNDEHTFSAIVRHLMNAATAAAIVSLLEELFFRGALFGALRRSFEWRFALVIGSALYAILHFFQRPPAPEDVHWFSGLVTLKQMLRGLIDLERLVPGFFALMLAGWILGLAYQRTGSLYVSIGLHAGWIFWLKSYGFLTHEETATKQWLWGTGKLIDGWIALIVLVAVLAGASRWLESKHAAAAPRYVRLSR